MNSDLSLEKQFILDYSRLTFSNKDTLSSSKYSNKLNWNEVFELSNINKVSYLIYFNIKKYFSDSLLKEIDMESIEIHYKKNKQRNDAVYREFYKLINEFIDKGVKVCPVKGIYLIDNIYRDRAIRGMNDIDLLFHKHDRELIKSIMENNGYAQGFYDSENNCVEPFSRELRILWTHKSYNLLPYTKLISNDAINSIKIDLSFALDFSLDTRPMDEMVEEAQFNGSYYQLLPEHILVHLCCHLYREATHTPWMKTGKDLILVKFCDVREFVIRKIDTLTLEKAIDFSRKYHIEKALYYTFYFLRELYNDGFETEVLSKLSIDDESFLYQFGNKEYSQVQSRKKSFLESIFSQSNMDEIVESPKSDLILNT